MYIDHYQGKIYKAMRKVQAVMDTPTRRHAFRAVRNINRQLIAST